MDSFNYILFGATGDLAKSKIFPALIQLFEKNLLPEKFNIIALGRTLYSDQEFRDYLLTSVKSNNSFYQKFYRNIYYISGNIDDDNLYRNIFDKLKKIKSHSNTNIYHLAILPNLYLKIASKLGQSILNELDSSNSKILIEKPYGIDKKSAKLLDKTLNQYFSENQIYRLDHYLGKDTVNNILAFRFGNGLFEPIWNHHFIDHVQIQLLESDDVKNREAFFDNTGTLLDIVQNHILQLLGLILMNRPADFSSDKIRSQKQEIIYSIKKILPENLVIGQYQDYQKNIGKKSNTETFVALKLYVDKNRWENMPIYIKTGKALKRKVTEIAIVFKKPPFNFFPKNKSQIPQSTLRLRINPDEGIVLDLAFKKPGLGMNLETQSLMYCYKDKNKLIEPYTRLLLDAFKSDQTSFNLKQEVLASWKFIDTIKNYIDKNKIKPLLYNKGSWGPGKADKLIEKDGRFWLEPSETFCKI